jgi:hypothetical protein
MTELELTTLLFSLAEKGITGIKVRYDGSGDNGAIEWIGYTKEACKTPENVDDLIALWNDDAYLALICSSSYSLIEDFAYEILDDIEDWANDEGGFGDLCICIPSGKYIINNNIRYVRIENYFHDGNLFKGC